MSDTFLQHRQASYKTSRQDLTTIIRKTLNDEIDALFPVKQGYANEVYSVRTKKGQDVIIRIQQQGVTGFKQEAWAMSRARSLGVPVPLVYDASLFDIAGKPHEVMVMQKAHGQSLAEVQGLEPSQLQQVCKELGLVLSKLHSAKINGFGFLKENKQAEFPNWQKFVTATLQQRDKDVPYLIQAGLSEAEALQMLKIVSEMKAQHHQEPVLCHGDLSFDHIFINDDFELTALIDWGLCQGGSPALDMTMLLMYHPDIELSWLLQSYQNLKISEAAFKRDMLIQQANVAMSFVGHNMREENYDARDIAVQGMRLLLANWVLL